MEMLNVYIEFVIKNKDILIMPAHLLEYILCFLIWKLSVKYKVKSNIDYILPDNGEGIGYRNNIL